MMKTHDVEAESFGVRRQSEAATALSIQLRATVKLKRRRASLAAAAQIALLGGFLLSGCANREVADSKPGTRSGNPFVVSPATGGQPSSQKIASALQFAAETRAKSGGTITVHLRGGTYFLDEPIVLRPEHSGIALVAYRGEKPVLSGGRRITGWKEVTMDGKKLWAADLPAVREGKWYFRELWVNGDRRPRARHPDKGYFKIEAVPDKAKTWSEGQKRFQFHQGDLKSWLTITNAEVVSMSRWIESRLPVVGVDESQRIANFAKRTVAEFQEGDPYYLEGALEVLDAPGEWYLDAGNGRLLYLPMPGERLGKIEAIAPALTQVVRIEGQPQAGQFVERVEFRGLTFAHTEWQIPRAGDKNAPPGWPAPLSEVGGFAQAAIGVPGAVWGEGVRECLFERCNFTQLGNYALELARGAQSNRIWHCEFADLGAGGIKIGETVIRTNASEIAQANVISDCRIHDGGRMFHSAIGIWIGQSPNNRIAHNLIHDFYYTGISVGWTWGYNPAALATNNLVEWNHVHHIGVQSDGDGPILSDMGGIYTLGRQPGTRIVNNLWHDIAAIKYGGWGIYFDEGSSGILAENNLVYRTTHGGFHQHYGETNIVRNNIFAFARDHQVQRSREEGHISFSFSNNIVLFDQGVLLGNTWGKSNRFILDSNLYWDMRPGAKPDQMKFAGATLEQWRQRGLDQHSLIADPLFTAPKEDDFRLKETSPAFKIGVRRFNLKGVGPQGANNWSVLDDPRPGYWLAESKGLGLWWCESGWKISRDCAMPQRPKSSAVKPVAVSAARGEYEPVQVVLRPERDGQLLSAEVTPLRSRSGRTAPVSVRMDEVAYVEVTTPTDRTCAPGWYPDPLPPLVTPLQLQARQNQPLWLTFHVPPETIPGDYTGALTLKTTLGDVRVPLAIRVYSFTLPAESHLRSALGLGTKSINRFHRLTRREDQEAVYEEYLKNFAEHRISPYSFFDYAPIDIRFVGEGADKRAQVDFTKFDQAAATWLDKHHFNTFKLPLRGMGGGTFHSRRLGELEGFQEGTPEHARLFKDYLSQIETHLRERGWLDKAYTYWFDEPDPKDYEFVTDGMKRLKAAAPGLKRMLTEQPEPVFDGHVDIWCGLTPEWTPEKVRARREAGEEVWWYICCVPKAPHVTEFIDHPGTELRLWPWQSWQYGAQGILVWETLWWTSPTAYPEPQLQDPWLDPMSWKGGYGTPLGEKRPWGNGDGRFLYPPRRDPNSDKAPSFDGPINSLRWENLRDGMEDYEYFWLLQQEIERVTKAGGETRLVTEARALLQVPEEISKDTTQYTTDPRPMLEHRERIARIIERLQRIR